MTADSNASSSGYKFKNHPRVAGIDFTTSQAAKRRKLRQIQKRIAASSGPKRRLFKAMAAEVKQDMKKIRNSSLSGRFGNTLKWMHRALDKREREICLMGRPTA